MIINHNMNAMNAHRNMGMNTNAAGKSMEKLSSGLRINRAGDDAAGLAISEKMRGQIRGLDQASRNAQDGISMIQTAEGALTETHNIVQRMRELAVQASNDTNTDKDREQIQKEINQLTEEVDRIANNTEFNTQKLLDGSKGTGSGINVQVGANCGQSINFEVGNMTAGSLLITATTTTGTGSAAVTTTNGLDVSDHEKATAAIEKYETALNNVSSERSKLGSIQNRLEYTTKNLDNTSENLQAAESRIRDVDMAKEMMNFSKNNILQQAAQAMVSQANQQPQGVLQLLR